MRIFVVLMIFLYFSSFVLAAEDRSASCQSSLSNLVSLIKLAKEAIQTPPEGNQNLELATKLRKEASDVYKATAEKGKPMPPEVSEGIKLADQLGQKSASSAKLWGTEYVLITKNPVVFYRFKEGDQTFLRKVEFVAVNAELRLNGDVTERLFGLLFHITFEPTDFRSEELTGNDRVQSYVPAIEVNRKILALRSFKALAKRVRLLKEELMKRGKEMGLQSTVNSFDIIIIQKSKINRNPQGRVSDVALFSHKSFEIDNISDFLGRITQGQDPVSLLTLSQIEDLLDYSDVNFVGGGSSRFRFRR